MPKAYAVVTYRSVSDPAKLAAYAKIAGPGFWGSLPCARQCSNCSRTGVKERTVVVEYANLKTATAAHDRPAYAEVLEALGDNAVRDFRIVEGVE